MALLMLSLFTAGGKDGEKISPVMATWCILAEDGSLQFSQTKKLPWQDACYGRATPVLWKWKLSPDYLLPYDVTFLQVPQPHTTPPSISFPAISDHIKKSQVQGQ